MRYGFGRVIQSLSGQVQSSRTKCEICFAPKVSSRLHGLADISMRIPGRLLTWIVCDQHISDRLHKPHRGERVTFFKQDVRAFEDPRTDVFEMRLAKRLKLRNPDVPGRAQFTEKVGTHSAGWRSV